MTSELAALFRRYRGRGLFLDANLLVVLAIGRDDPNLIAHHKRTRGEYTPEDHRLLLEVIASVSPLLTTPHVLTEVSNLLGQTPGVLRYVVYESFSALIDGLEELHIPGPELADHAQLAVFGLTDLAILQTAASRRCLVITDDAALADFLGRSGVDAIPFSQIRTLDRGW